MALTLTIFSTTDATDGSSHSILHPQAYLKSGEQYMH
jgi:hypothetical protein